MSDQSSQEAKFATDLERRRIVVGVSGGIAAYKSADLVRRLRQRGAQVRVVMTHAATGFVTPLTFQALSGETVHTQLLDERAEAAMGHIELARWAELVIAAPATANLMARLAAGLADDLLTTLCLATAAPILLAPAMNVHMWTHPATQVNRERLLRNGYRLLGPGDGAMACGDSGDGRMLEPAELVEQIEFALTSNRVLADLKVLMTAGPTFEDLDPVRYLGNRSSGRMGFALATAARQAAAEVTLVTGPVHLPTPVGVTRVDVRSAAQMREQVMARVGDANIFIAAAAVADFRPISYAKSKIKKGDCTAFQVEMCRNPDILAEVAALSEGPFTVGFAAETERVNEYARSKLSSKGVDMIAANRVGVADRGFDADCNELTVLWTDGQEKLPLASKQALSRRLVALIATRYRSGPA